MLTQGDSEVNLETLARDELIRLQRQYRLMEGDRKALNEQTGATVDKQKRIVFFLEKERENLLVDLSNAVCLQWLEKDKRTYSDILDILDKFVEHKLEIDYQLSQIEEMDEQVDKITRRVVAQKLKVQGIFGNSMSLGQIDKRRRVLEDRLYHCTTLHDAQVTENKAIREEVTMSLLERGKFHKRYLAMKQKIQRMKKKMAEIVDIASSTYDQREEDTAKIQSLRERNDKDSKQHVFEMKEAQRVLHHDQKGRTFMLAKGKPRPLLEEDDVRLKRMELAKERTLDDLLQSYKRSFQDILLLANTGDIETLVQNYLNQEQTNFCKFRYISDLNEELTVLLQEIGQIKLDIDESLLVHQKIKQDQLKKMVELDTKFRADQHRYKKTTEKRDKMELYMEKVLQSLRNMLKITHCEDSSVFNLLGKQSGVQPRNALLAFGALERRIAEIQNEKSLLEVRKAIEIDGLPAQLPSKAQNLPGSSGAKAKVNGGPYKPKVMIAGRLQEEANDVNEDEDANNLFVATQKPLSYEEIRKNLLGKLQAESQSQDPLANSSYSTMATIITRQTTSVRTKTISFTRPNSLSNSIDRPLTRTNSIAQPTSRGNSEARP